MKSPRGFTLVELIIVVVIIGIIASIAIPKFGNSKEKSMVAAMKSDLRNMATAQEAFFYDSSYYADNHLKLYRVIPTQGVTLAVQEATAQGWSAEASHSQTPKKCYLFSGSAAPVGLATAEGRITCG